MLFGKKKKQTPFVTAVIPAAGSSRRMGGGNKLLMELDGVPVLGRTLLALEACEIIREIIVAASEEHIVTYAELGKALGITKLTKVSRVVTPVRKVFTKQHCKPIRSVPIWRYMTVHARWSHRMWCGKPVKVLSFTLALLQVLQCMTPSKKWRRTDIFPARWIGRCFAPCRHLRLQIRHCSPLRCRVP